MQSAVDSTTSRRVRSCLDLSSGVSFFFSSRRRHTRCGRDWSSDVCSSDLTTVTTKHLGEGIAADYDAEGRLAGIEILDAAKRLGDPGVLRQVIVEGIGSECD